MKDWMKMRELKAVLEKQRLERIKGGESARTSVIECTSANIEELLEVATELATSEARMGYVRCERIEPQPFIDSLDSHFTFPEAPEWAVKRLNLGRTLDMNWFWIGTPVS